MRRKRRIIICAIAAVVLLLLILSALDVRLRVVSYTVSNDRIQTPVRIVLITDLHSNSYGEGQKTLLDAIDAQKPDLILFGGDIFDDELPNDNTLIVLEHVSARYPCFYVSGNHENWSAQTEELYAAVRGMGITILDGDCETLAFGQTTLRLCGIADPYFGPEELKDQYPDKSKKELREIDKARTEQAYTAALETLCGNVRPDAYTLLLVHRPEWIELYARYGYDLVTAGHAHGGQVRIPGILNGLFSPGERWFPKYAGGQYEVGVTTMIVSRGLSREAVKAPRIWNRPELVVIDLKPQSEQPIL